MTITASHEAGTTLRPDESSRSFQAATAHPEDVWLGKTAPGRGDTARVSPTILRVGGYRFFFFSREEARAHVHVYHSDGEAKVWLDPYLEMAQNQGLGARRVATILRLAREHEGEIRIAWRKHFGD